VPWASICARPDAIPGGTPLYRATSTQLILNQLPQKTPLAYDMSNGMKLLIQSLGLYSAALTNFKSYARNMKNDWLVSIHGVLIKKRPLLFCSLSPRKMIRSAQKFQ